MFSALKIMQESLRRHKEAFEVFCASTGGGQTVRKLPEPIKKMPTNQNIVSPL